ncbi:MAG: DUF4230 domain-containing protein [Gemmatimonadaceae bacterium]
MTQPVPPPAPPTASPPAAPARASRLPWVLLASVLFFMFAVGYCGVRAIPNVLGRGGSSITHDLVVERMRAVAKLVSTEATVRDVVVFQNTRLGSTKRTLVVVTGRLMAGVNLGANPVVRIDQKTRRIAVELPKAELIGVEVLNLRTYDESAGLWNPFTPADRDSIQRQVRTQLMRAGNDMALLEHANQSARDILRTMLSQDGYTVDVTTRGAPKPAGTDR